MKWLLLAAVSVSVGCSEGPDSAARQQAAVESAATRPGEGVSAELLVDEASGVRFPLPPGVGADVQHFDPTLPPWKFRHLIELHTTQGVAVIIEVWDNPARQPLEAWFEENMAFLVDGETRVSQRAVTTAKVPALLLEQPRSPMAVSLGFAIFAAGARVYRVSVIDADAEVSAYPRALFEQVLDQLDVGVAR